MHPADEPIRLREIWPPGTVIKGDFVIERRLSSGGFGTVYLARNRFMGTLCVIKRLHEQFASDAEYVRKFVNEGRAIRRLRGCPHIVEVEHMTQSEDGHLILVMEFVSGGDLSTMIESRALAPDEVIEYSRQIALGLQAAHWAGLVHRDIKPQNILIGQDSTGRVQLKLIDFGIAADHLGSHHTSVMRGGSIGYAAPEQWMKKGKELDSRTDLYSLGATMYRMLTGQMPYPSVFDIGAWIDEVRKGPPKPVHEVRAGIPMELSRLVQDLLAVQVDDRPGDAGTVINRLNEIQAYKGPVYTPTISIEHAPTQFPPTETRREPTRMEPPPYPPPPVPHQQVLNPNPWQVPAPPLPPIAPVVQAGGTGLILAVAGLSAVGALLHVGLFRALFPVQAEFHLASSLTRTLSLIFLAGLAVGSPIAGIVIDRFGTRYVVSAGLIMSALGSALAAAASSLEPFAASCLLMGLGLSVVIPAACALFASYSEQRRGVANGVRELVIGLTGAAFAVLYPLIFGNLGWRALFGCSAGASLIFAICWFAAARSFPRNHPAANVVRGLLSMTALGCVVAYVGYFVCLDSIEFWISRIFGLKMRLSIPLACGLAALVSGWWSDRLVRFNGANASKIRKRFVVCGLLLSGLAGFVTLAGGGEYLMLSLGIVSAAGLGGTIPNLWAIVQREAPVGTAGTWGGVLAVCGGPGTLVMNRLINLQRADGSNGIFLGAGFVLLAAVAAALLIRPSAADAGMRNVPNQDARY